MEEASPNKKSLFETRYWMVCLIAFAAGFVFLAGRYGEVSYSDQLMFLLSQIVFVLVPGMAVTSLICPQAEKIKFALLSYLVGIALVLLEFYMVYNLQAQQYLIIVMCGVSLLSIWPLYKKSAVLREMPMDNRSGWAISALLAVLLTLVFFSAVYASKTPDFTGHAYMSYYQDLIWNAGNTTAIANGFPVMDIHVAGLTFSYHFFTNVYLAAFKNILGISSFVLYLKFLPVLQVIVFICTLHLFFSQLTKKAWINAALCALTFLSSIILMRHMLWQAYATMFALSFTVICAYFFIRLIKNIETVKVLRSRDFWMFLIFLAVVVGAKILFVGVILGGAGMVFLVQIIRRKNALQMFLGGVMMIAAFCAVYFPVLSGAQGFNGLSLQLLSPMLVDNPGYYQALLPALGNAGAALIAYPVYLFLNHTVIVLSAVMLIVALAVRKLRDKLTAVFLLMGILAGMVAASVFLQPGESNVLFMETAAPFAVFAVYFVMKDVWKRENIKKAAKIVLLCVIAGVMAVSIIPTVGVLSQDWKDNAARLANVSPYDGISVYEYQGMEWLRENTPADAVVASDRQYYVPGADPQYARYFYYTAFSERQNYLEGYYYVNTYSKDYMSVINARIALLQGVYAGNQNNLAELAGGGVDYLVSSKFATPEFWLDTRYGDIVYQNQGITIYRLHPAKN